MLILAVKGRVAIQQIGRFMSLQLLVGKLVFQVEETVVFGDQLYDLFLSVVGYVLVKY